MPVFIKADISVPLLTSFLFILQSQWGLERCCNFCVFGGCISFFHESQKNISGTELLEGSFLTLLSAGYNMLKYSCPGNTYIHLYIMTIAAQKYFQSQQKNYIYMCVMLSTGRVLLAVTMSYFFWEKSYLALALFVTPSPFSIVRVVYCI